MAKMVDDETASVDDETASRIFDALRAPTEADLAELEACLAHADGVQMLLKKVSLGPCFVPSTERAGLEKTEG